MMRYAWTCDECDALALTDGPSLPLGWRVRRRRRVRRADGTDDGGLRLDCCPRCAEPLPKSPPQRVLDEGRRNRQAVSLALQACPRANDRELALYLAGEGVEVHPETVRRHRVALGVPARRRGA